MSWSRAAAVAALVLCGCSRLPQIAANVCGNHVVEQGEDCDGFERDGLSCRAPGDSGQCHMDCSPMRTGTTLACPTGFGCDAQNVCRKATGGFVAVPERSIGNAASLASADFDGDGRQDILSSEPPLQNELTKVRAHYYDRAGMHAHAWNSSVPVASPQPFAAVHGSRAHLGLLLKGGALGVMTGEADGTMIPEALPTYLLRNTQARLVDVADEPIDRSAAWIVVCTIDGQPGLYRQSNQAQSGSGVRLARVLDLDHGAEDLAAEPVTASFFGQRACREMVLAFRGTSELHVYSTCSEPTPTAPVIWRDVPGVLNLPLEPPAEISGGLLAADVNGDGRLDLVVGSKAGPYVALATGAGLGPLTPRSFVPEDGSDADAGSAEAEARLAALRTAMPLAIGDLSGDGLADVVMPGFILVAQLAAGEAAPTYHVAAGNTGPAWTEAKIADFNADGHLDAVAVSAQGLDIAFFNGTGSNLVNDFTISTDRPVEQLQVGDMDGDLINDLALVQRARSTEMLDEVSIAYGNPAGALSPPKRVALLDRVQQVLLFYTGDGNKVGYLSVLSTYHESGVDQLGSALAVLSGYSDRTTPSYVELTTFSQDQSLLSHVPLTLTGGQFQRAGAVDVLILAYEDPDVTHEPTYSFWLLADIEGQRRLPVKLGWGLPADVMPMDGEQHGRRNASLVAGDLDGDGRDEAIIAVLAGERSSCFIASARVSAEGVPTFESIAGQRLDAPCDDTTQLSVADLDGDGQRDVLVLHGVAGASRTLAVLYGDGSGGLDAAARVELDGLQGEPLAVSVLARHAGEPAVIAYVSATELHVLRATAGGRGFEDLGAIASLEQGTGVVAADINGDGLPDLAVADAGAVRVWLAGVEGQ